MGNDKSKVTVDQRKFIVFFAVLACVNAIVLVAAVMAIATSYTLHNATVDARMVYLYAAAVSILGLSVLAFSGVAIRFAVKAIKAERKQSINIEDISEAILHHAPTIVSVWDQSGNILAVSEQAIKLFGLTHKEQYINLLFTELSPKLQPCGTPSLEKGMMYMSQAFREGQVTFEWQHKTLAGEDFPAECTLVRVNRTDDDPIVLGFASDLRPTIKARNEELERRTYQKLQIILDAAPLGCSILDENFQVIGCNSAALELFGARDLQEYKQQFLNLSPEYQPDGALSVEKRARVMQQVMEEGYVQYEWLSQSLDGTPIPVEVTIVRATVDNKTVKVGYLRDLRQFYTQLEKEQEASEHYDLMINTIPLLVNYWGHDNTLKGYNQFSADYYSHYIKGVSSVSEAFRNVFDSTLVGTEWFDRLNEIFETGASRFEFEDLTGTIWEVEGVRTVYKGEPVVVTYGKDITKLKQLESEQRLREIAEESNIAKTMFIANISHEIRTPMNSILGYSELALEDDLPQNTREYLNMIVTSSKLLLSIVNDVLDISKIEADMLKFESIPFTAEDIIDQCKDMLQQKASEKGLILKGHVMRRNLTTSLKGKCFLGDTIKIIQICINLLSNAIKFTKSGGAITMSIEIKEADENTCTLRFECSDTGIGMTEEQMSRVFEPFMQADSSTKREYGGTGLGLTIAKRLINAMGSELHVQSALGVGSKFSFDLTVPLIDISEGQYGEPALAIKKPMFESGTVLVVDDNEINLGVACEHLKRVGLTPAIARDGKEAVEKVKYRHETGMPPYDLILMDLHMPEMDGKEASILISEFNTGTPIIAMTAETINLSDDALYEKFRVHGYLSKPFTSQKIWQCLLTHLNLAVNTTETTAPTKDEDYIGDDELRQELTALFMESNQDTAQKLANYLECGDIKNAHMLMHSLKSSSRIIGKATLGDMAEKVEKQLNAGRPSPALVQQLTGQLQQAIHEYYAR